MAGSMISMTMGAAAVLCALEEKASPLLALKLAGMGAKIPQAASLALPAAYAGVVAVNAVGGTFTMMKLGMDVGKARKKYNVEVRKKTRDCARDCTHALRRRLLGVRVGHAFAALGARARREYICAAWRARALRVA